MSFSVILPARDMDRTMEPCLHAVFDSSALPAEVIVVDDGSTDATAKIARSFGCRLAAIDSRSGPMEPRFAGARLAQFPVLVFVDADVCVRPDTFEKILKKFQDPGVQALTGILSTRKSGGSFFSDYKNFYMQHIFLSQPSEAYFLYGSLWAIRRESMVFFRPITRPFGSLVSDSEAGMRLERRGKKIILDHTLEVDHLKQYTFLSLLKNDFVIPFLFSLMLVRYGGLRRILERKSFSHASTGQVRAMVCAFLSAGFAVSAIFFKSFYLLFAGVFFLVLFYAHWRPFFARLRAGGIIFQGLSSVFQWIDANVMFLGMISGFIFSMSGFFRKRGFFFR